MNNQQLSSEFKGRVEDITTFLTSRMKDCTILLNEESAREDARFRATLGAAGLEVIQRKAEVRLRLDTWAERPVISGYKLGGGVPPDVAFKETATFLNLHPNLDYIRSQIGNILREWPGSASS